MKTLNEETPPGRNSSVPVWVLALSMTFTAASPAVVERGHDRSAEVVAAAQTEAAIKVAELNKEAAIQVAELNKEAAIRIAEINAVKPAVRRAGGAHAATEEGSGLPYEAAATSPRRARP